MEQKTISSLKYGKDRYQLFSGLDVDAIVLDRSCFLVLDPVDVSVCLNLNAVTYQKSLIANRC